MPVAAFPVRGPMDVLTDATGVMDERLDAAVRQALLLDRAACARHGRSFNWRRSAEQFLASLNWRTVAPVECAA